MGRPCGCGCGSTRCNGPMDDQLQNSCRYEPVGAENITAVGVPDVINTKNATNVVVTAQALSDSTGSFSRVTVAFDSTGATGLANKGYIWLAWPTGETSVNTLDNSAAFRYSHLRIQMSLRSAYATKALANAEGFDWLGDGVITAGFGLLARHSLNDPFSFQFEDFSGATNPTNDCWEQYFKEMPIGALAIGDSGLASFYNAQMDDTAGNFGNDLRGLKVIELLGGIAGDYTAADLVGEPGDSGAIDFGPGVLIQIPATGSFRIAFDVSDFSSYKRIQDFGSFHSWLTTASTFGLTIGAASMTLSHATTLPDEVTLYDGTGLTGPSGWVGQDVTVLSDDYSGYDALSGQPGPYVWAFKGEATVNNGKCIAFLIFSVSSSTDYQSPTMRLVIEYAADWTHTEDDIPGGDSGDDQDRAGYTNVYADKLDVEFFSIVGAGLALVPNPAAFAGNAGIKPRAWLRPRKGERAPTYTCDWGGDAYSSGIYESPTDPNGYFSTPAFQFTPPLIPNVGNGPQSSETPAGGWRGLSDNADGQIHTFELSVTP